MVTNQSFSANTIVEIMAEALHEISIIVIFIGDIGYVSRDITRGKVSSSSHDL